MSTLTRKDLNLFNQTIPDVLTQKGMGQVLDYVDQGVTSGTAYVDAQITVVNGEITTLTNDVNTVGLSSAAPLAGTEKVRLLQGGVGKYATVDDIRGGISTTVYFYSASYATLDAAITAIGATSGVLIIHSALSAVLDCTVPATLSVQFVGAGVLTVPTTKTVTFNGSCDGPLRKIFNLVGTGLVAFTKTFRFYPEWWGALMDNTTNDAPAIQYAIKVAENDNAFGGGIVELQAGKYKITTQLVQSKRNLCIWGKGMQQTWINFTGVAAGAFTTTALLYCRPSFRDFNLDGNAASGAGLDFMNVTGEVYGGDLTNLIITSGEQCIHAILFFSMNVTAVYGYSFNNHVFHVLCGPGVVWTECYAIFSPSGKAGYRLAGLILLNGCNGVNSADYWGVFGSDAAGSDGFQNDFVGTIYPDVTMINCNVEAFVTCGIYFPQSINHFTWIGGKIDRNALSSDYHSMVRFAKVAANVGSASRLRLSQVFKGTGVPNGGGVLTNAWLYATTGGCHIVDETGAFASAGITGMYSAAVAGLYPLMTSGFTGESFQVMAQTFSSIQPRRLNVQMLRYLTSALTPVGAGQAIVVTGVTKVMVTPASAASITTATFVTTLGVTSDTGRNSDLIIEAVNANLTVNHTAQGGAANTFVMAAGANLAMAAGQVIRFLRSETTSQWIQY